MVGCGIYRGSLEERLFCCQIQLPMLTLMTMLLMLVLEAEAETECEIQVPAAPLHGMVGLKNLLLPNRMELLLHQYFAKSSLRIE
jgi:hypothetical protein